MTAQDLNTASVLGRVAPDPFAQMNGEAAPVHIISLGAGVQSSTMALMAARGLILPRPIGAIFADTQDEPASVYRWLDRARLPRNKTPCQTATYGQATLRARP
jgi:hypothetical protein